MPRWLAVAFANIRRSRRSTPSENVHRGIKPRLAARGFADEISELLAKKLPRAIQSRFHAAF